MKNKKGFTLVELLAVIAILAILVIIALPNILNLYRNARENVFVEEAQNVLRTAQQKYLEDSMNNTAVECYSTDEGHQLDLDAKSSLHYYVQISGGKIVKLQVEDGNYQLVADGSSTGAEIKLDQLGNKSSNKTYKSAAYANLTVTKCPTPGA